MALRDTRSYSDSGSRTNSREYLEAKRKEKMQASLLVFCAIAIVVGTRMAKIRQNAEAPVPVTESALVGQWDLANLGKDVIGAQPACVITAQHITIKDGSVSGQTTLRVGPDTSTNMPFPDQTVTSVHTSSDGASMVVSWKGDYKLHDHGIMDLTVGKAMYKAKVDIDAKTADMLLDHDFVLALQGACRYRASTPPK